MNLSETLFGEFADVRYVATYLDGELALAERPGLSNASDSGSDRYEELLVNPAVLTLARQRGDIDCGGLDYVLIRYGSFFQLVMPVSGGHVSVAIEPGPEVLAVVDRVRARVGASH